jgi:hypothetical protein
MSNDREQYEHVCKNEFKEIKTSLDKFYVAIFEGRDGEEGLKTQVQMHGKFISGLLWLAGVLTVAVITALVEVHMKGF